MPDDRPDPLADLFTLFASPLSGTVRSIEQFRKGVDEFLRGVENFNRTMENLNEATERINSLLIEVEQPIRAAIPQVTRTVKTADEMMQVVSGPAMAVAPGLNRLAETLSTPAFAQLPAQIGTFSDVLGEVSKRLGPLTQLAESAGGLFGGFRIPGSRLPAQAPSTTPRPETSDRATSTKRAETTPDEKPPAEKIAAKKAPAKKRPAKTTTARKSTAKKATPKQAAPKQAAPKRAAAKTTAAKTTAPGD
jgi:hypothetical protein